MTTYTTKNTITILSVLFEGPYTDVNQLHSASGNYVVLGRNQVGGDYNIVDNGISERDIKDRIKNHDRQNCWKAQKYKELSVAVRYTNNLSEMYNLEKAIRDTYNPPCGER